MRKYPVAESFEGGEMGNFVNIGGQKRIGIQVPVYGHNMVVILCDESVVSQFCLSFGGDDELEAVFLPKRVTIVNSRRREIFTECGKRVHLKRKRPHTKRSLLLRLLAEIISQNQQQQCQQQL